MPTTQQGVTEVMLHTDCGELWFGVGRPQATRWPGSRSDFVRQDWVLNSDCIRVLGSNDNADLIVDLHNAKFKSGAPCKIQLASPWACRLDRGVPEVFRQMLEMAQAPSVGGWHTMNQCDYTVYALSVESRKARGKLTDTVMCLLQAHPAWSALSFIPTINFEVAAQLLYTIIDPRFHIDPANPDRNSRLKAFMGVEDASPGIHNVRAYLQDRAEQRHANFGRAELLLDTWCGGWRHVAAQDVVGPRDFLMRIVKIKAGHKGEDVAVLRASHVFLRFLRDVWLDRLTAPREFGRRVEKLGRKRTSKVKRSVMQACKSYTPTLFVPVHFFERPDEIGAWMAHQAVVAHLY